MKKFIILFFIFSFVLMGCAQNENMARIVEAQNNAYKTAMIEYYKNLPKNDGEIVNIQVDPESGKFSGIKVYDQNRKLPPPPKPPEPVKTWGAEMMEASSDVLITGMKWGAGLFAVKIITDNAGDNINGSYNANSNNNAGNNQNIGGGEISDIGSVSNKNISNSHNSADTQTSESTNENYAYENSYNQDNDVDNSTNDSYNPNNSTNDSYNTDNSSNNSQNPIDNSQNQDYTDQYSGDTNSYYSTP